MITLIILLFIGIPVVSIISLCLMGKKLKTYRDMEVAEENNEKLQPEKMDRYQIEILYLNYKFGDFIFKAFPKAVQWKAISENVAMHYEGYHTIRLYYSNGTWEDVITEVKDGILQVYKKEPEKGKSLKEQASEWMKKWQPTLLKEQPFMISKDELPEQDVLDMVLDAIGQSGLYMIQLLEDGVHFCPIESGIG